MMLIELLFYKKNKIKINEIKANHKHVYNYFYH